MRMYIFSIVICLIGCTNSAEIAQRSLYESQQKNTEIIHSLAIKSWGLNRALITESREKHFLKAKIELKELIEEDKYNQQSVEKILNELNKQIGMDEAVISENFAYISFLLIAQERTNEFLSIVDQFVESKKPIWHHFEEQKEYIDKEIDQIKKMWNNIVSFLGV